MQDTSPVARVGRAAMAVHAIELPSPAELERQRPNSIRQKDSENNCSKSN